LEPCSHFGKTPPCAAAVIAAGVSRVFIGMIDPNPRVSGSGVKRLQSAGIEVQAGILEQECRSINRPFIKQITTGLPHVTMKSAMTLDGCTATPAGDSKWISSEASRRHVHRLRSRMDAVMTGSGTLLADDPQLTVRMAKGKSPLRIVIDSDLQTPVASALMAEAHRVPVLIATASRDEARGAALTAAGAEIICCPGTDGRVDLPELLKILGKRGIQSILLEAGERLCGELQRQGLIDSYLFFIAPKLLGGIGKGLFAGAGAALMQNAARLEIERVIRIGGDILVAAVPEGKCSQD
ncbi:MAG: bifunctional diaminohydroxyphosphoribosylaminopyrimidine deaminase/5-amino-6-(5-phosphoribosylamino)uracil reductase RibD, partial [Geobacter sp.]|nr:bifunctional diaminohydroxyphosphoribosylaminopyrimidine deaminase/5-amino-6-(5-phosphoribosylamino)uracil reductase RibD [Geobacter sp.]